ncbi:MAG TPA: hypothetical protein VGH82_04500 [Gaiellaceae bacterium]
MTAWAERVRALRTGIAAARRRSPAVDAAFETIERDSDLGGAILAGALAYRLFLFALPLAFFLVSGAGLMANALGIEPNLIPKSVGFTGVITKQVASESNGSSSWWVALSSFFIVAYATRVLFRAIAIVHALAWDRSAASVKIKSRALGMFGAMLATEIALGAGVGAINHQTAIGGLVALALYVFASAGLWLVISLHVPHGNARLIELIPGSLLYGIGVAAVSLFNVLILGSLIKSKSSTYGTLGIAATLLLGFFFVGRIMVGAAVVNATLHERRIRLQATPPLLQEK